MESVVASVPKYGFASMGSGSQGNGTLLCFDSTRLLIDCGFTLKQTLLRLLRLGLAPEDLSAVLVTHEHSDHINGVLPLARRYGLPVYLSHGTKVGLRGDTKDIDLRPLPAGAEFYVGDVHVMAVPVPHDAREPIQFVAQSQGRRIGVLTDIGHITDRVQAAYAGCQGLLVESNHDLEMLRNGPYPPRLQRRVGGNYGHLNNEQALAFVQALAPAAGSRVLIGHISEKNNCPALLTRLYEPLRTSLPLLAMATQTGGSDWVALD